MSGEGNGERKKYGLLDSLAMIIMLVAAFIILDKYTSLFDSGKKEVAVNIGNNGGLKFPITTSTYDGNIGGPAEEKHLDMLPTGSYLPKDKIFEDQKVFAMEAIKVALKGEFLEANLHVEGNTNNEIRNFVSITVDYESGVYKAERTKNGGLIYSPEENAVFKKTPIKVDVDLMYPTKLSTTKLEFDEGKGSYKFPILWKKIQPPPRLGAVANFSIIPFGEDGIPSSEITKIQLDYRCADEGNKCQAILCGKGESEQKCLDRVKKL